MHTTQKDLLKVLKRKKIPITWATIYQGHQEKHLTNREVISYAINLISPHPSAIDNDLIPLASAHASDPNIKQLLERMLSYDKNKPNFTIECKKWRYALLQQLYEKYKNLGSLSENSGDDILSDIFGVYTEYDFTDGLNDIFDGLCGCCISRLTNINDLMLSLHEFLQKQAYEFKNSDKNSETHIK